MLHQYDAEYFVKLQLLRCLSDILIENLDVKYYSTLPIFVEIIEPLKRTSQTE